MGCQRLILIARTWLAAGGISAMDYKSLTSSVASTPQIFIGLLYRRGVEATDNMEIWLLSVVASAFPFLVGLVLIYFPATIANRMVSAGTATIDTLLLQQVAFSVLGLYFVTVAAYDAVYWWAKLRIYFAVYNELNDGRPDRLRPEDFAGIASTCTQLIAGVILLFGGRGLANLIHRLRSPPRL